MEVRESWLESVVEEIVDPGRRIVDPHHHFFARSSHFPRYDLETLRKDAASHNVEQTVYLQCWEGHREDGPEHLRPVGETEWVNGIAERGRQQPGGTQIGGMVGTTDLRDPRVREVLEAHRAASPLFRGIRQPAAWDADPSIMRMPGIDDANVYGDPRFRAGVAALAEMGFSLDAYHYHTQTPHLTALARAVPQATIVLDHLGTPLGVGAYAGRRQEIFAEWKRGLAELATCPNVAMKLGGLAMPWNGFGFESRPKPPTSDEIVAAQGDYYRYAIDTFGPARCMFESNFPVDKCALSYAVLWNAFKKIAAPYTEAERDGLFHGTACRVYRLKLVAR